MKLLRRLLCLLPTRLPQGVTEFNIWADDIIDMSGLPNNNSMKAALAAAIMHAKAGKAYWPRQYFISILQRGAANQVAHAEFTAIHEKDKLEKAKAAEAAAKTDENSATNG